MDERMVTPIPKARSKRSPQQQRRTQWQREYETAQVVVRERSRGWCEVDGCDRPADTFHHRKGRRAANANDPAMILHCCTPDHLRIHANPAWAYAEGYMVSRTS